MAVNDRTPKTLISKALSATAGDSTYANTSTSYRTEITSIIITAQNGNSTERTITIYKGGSSAGNEKFNIDVDPTGVNNPKTVVIQAPFILTSTEAIFIKQDTGTDVNVEVSGVEEQLS